MDVVVGCTTWAAGAVVVVGLGKVVGASGVMDRTEALATATTDEAAAGRRSTQARDPTSRTARRHSSRRRSRTSRHTTPNTVFQVRSGALATRIMEAVEEEVGRGKEGSGRAASVLSRSSLSCRAETEEERSGEVSVEAMEDA